MKRPADACFSLVALAVLAPVLGAAAAGIWVTSAGPILFVQERVGRDGRLFRLYKLRTMDAGRRHDPDEVVPLGHAEITRWGRLLRRFKIDELPQLLNVLKGDMAVIGPRPTLPEQTNAYNDFERRRLEVRPGLTGLAQVNGSASMSWEERIRYDVHYVDYSDLPMDVGIFFKTMAVILLGEERFARSFEGSPYGEGGE